MRYKVKVNKYGTYWYKEGTNILHRLDGPAKEYSNGTKEYWVDGKCHREDGPAFEYADGSKSWYKEGQLHRLDGPAIEYVNGYKEYWVDGKQLTKEEFYNSKTSFTKEELKNMSLEELHRLISN